MTDATSAPQTPTEETDDDCCTTEDLAAWSAIVHDELDCAEITESWTSVDD